MTGVLRTVHRFVPESQPRRFCPDQRRPRLAFCTRLLRGPHIVVWL